ncbi:HNH endonuclease signature motif containing protein [Brevundimonas sp.]|uniref:HNH endonuclease signature motif containing protein n=1 Tax=Brevundimonas sp. TaxID=1871086 RepID=UPI002FC8DF03
MKFTDGTYKSVTVHSMVAAAWHGERPLGLDVHHIDHDKTNNAACNLVYMSRSRNVIESKIEAMSRGTIIAWCAMAVGQTVAVPQDYKLKRLADRVRAISKALGRQFEYCAMSGTVTRTA